MMQRRLFLAGAASLAAAPLAWAHDYKLGTLAIFHPWTRATVGRTGAIYLGFKNGGAPDRLIAVECAIAARAEMHTTIAEGSVMRMRQLDGTDVPVGISLLKPGGTHIMLLDLKQQLKLGDHFQARLTFEKAGAIAIEVQVDKPGADAPAHTN
jgi:copper(I)-binding protein